MTRAEDNRGCPRISGRPWNNFTRIGRSRVCFDKDEEDASAAYFCGAGSRGISTYYDASDARLYVRPRFIIIKS